MADRDVRYKPYEFAGPVGEDIDMAAVAIVLLLAVAVYGLGFLGGWLACWLVL